MSDQLTRLELLLHKIDKRLAGLERHIRKEQETGHWLTPEEAHQLTGLKPATLRKKFYAGIIEHRRTAGGRKPRYLKEELEEKFIHQS